MTNDIRWEDGTPCSRHFADVYYSKSGGLDESRHVYLGGVNLAELAANGQGRIVRIGELGFGTGLNFVASAEQWRANSNGGVLHYVAVEKYPLSKEDLQKSLRHFSEIAYFADKLCDLYGSTVVGMHRLWIDHDILLDLWLGDVRAVLPQWQGRFDGWYMDGFSPKRNPEMFSEKVCAELARLSGNGTMVATFSVAGWVRRNLDAQGFMPTKREGFGCKSQCLQAEFKKSKKNLKSVKSRNLWRVAILGSGIAGASCAEQFAHFGVACDVYSHPQKNTASDISAAVVAPRFSATDSARGRQISLAYSYALRLYGQCSEAVLARGAMKLPSKGITLSRLEQACATWQSQTASAPEMLTADQAALITGDIPLGIAQYLPSALVVETHILRAWLLRDAVHYENMAITSVERRGDAWWLVDEAGQAFGAYDNIILACGANSHQFLPDITEYSTVRSGQAEFYRAEEYPTCAIGGWGGHYAPAKGGFWYGQSRDEQSSNAPKRLAEWGIDYAARGQEWCADKLSIAGHWPLCGKVPDQQGLFVLAGAGGHGFALMPWLASLLVTDLLDNR